MERQRLVDAAAVLAATDDDPYARNTVRPDAAPAHGWCRNDAVVWMGVDAEDREPVASALGPPRAAADLVSDVLPDVPPGVLLTVEESTAAHLPASTAFRPRFHWLFRTRTTPPPVPDHVPVRVLPGAGDARIATLLGEATDGPSSAWPGDPAVRRWAVVEEDGRLLACAADTSGARGVGHMGSVAVHPDARRRGLGTAVVAWLTSDLLTAGGCDTVAVGVFVHEGGAQRLYDGLGYRTHHEFRTGRFAPEG